MRTLYQTLNCLPGPHGRQRHLKVGRGRQKYDFLYDRDIHSTSRTRNTCLWASFEKLAYKYVHCPYSCPTPKMNASIIQKIIFRVDPYLL